MLCHIIFVKIVFDQVVIHIVGICGLCFFEALITLVLQVFISDGNFVFTRILTIGRSIMSSLNLATDPRNRTTPRYLWLICLWGNHQHGRGRSSLSYLLLCIYSCEANAMLKRVGEPFKLGLHQTGLLYNSHMLICHHIIEIFTFCTQRPMRLLI